MSLFKLYMISGFVYQIIHVSYKHILETIRSLKQLSTQKSNERLSIYIFLETLMSKKKYDLKKQKKNT